MKVTEEFNSLVKILCDEISTVEWSGILFYEAEGDMNSEEGMVITPIDIYLMDKGEGASTHYEFGEDVFDYYDAHEDRFGMKYGHIHSHHNMGAYFSGVDTNELNENCVKHEYYVSVVVDNKNKLVGRVAIHGEREITPTKYFLKGIAGCETTFVEGEKKKEHVMYWIEMEVEKTHENTVDNPLFFKRLEEIKSRPATRFNRGYNSTYQNNVNHTNYSTPEKTRNSAGGVTWHDEDDDYDRFTNFLDVEPRDILKYCLGADKDSTAFTSEILVEFVNKDESINEKKAYIDYAFEIQNVELAYREYDRKGDKPNYKQLKKVYKGIMNILNSYSTGHVKIIKDYIITVIEDQLRELDEINKTK